MAFQEGQSRPQTDAGLIRAAFQKKSENMSRQWGKLDFLRGLLTGMLMLFSSGCIYLVVGSVGALGGYVVSPDTVEGVLDNKAQGDVWQAAVDIIGVMGIIEESNEPGGIILAKIQGTKVTITIMEISPDTVKLSVKARKAFLPKIRLSQDIYSKIVQKVNG